MIYKALFILSGSLPSTPEDFNNITFLNEGDAEIYGHIYEIAKSYKNIYDFKLECDIDKDISDLSDSETEDESDEKQKEEDESDEKKNEEDELDERKKEVEEEFFLYTQALSEGLTDCLEPYLQTLFEVDQLVSRNPMLTLAFVYSYVEKYRGLFNTLNRMINTIKSQNLVGCQLLSHIHQYILSGDDKVHEAVLKIFSALNRVFVTQLTYWLLSGQLRDPSEEFFVCQTKKEISKVSFDENAENKAISEKAGNKAISEKAVNKAICEKAGNKAICEKAINKAIAAPPLPDPFDTTELVTVLQNTSLDSEFTLNPSMIPQYIPLSLAQDILFIGKTVILFGNEPRIKLNENGVTEFKFSIWDDRLQEFHKKMNDLKKEESLEGHNLRLVVKEIKECINKNLWSTAVEEAHLLHELQVIKDFFLLGRGELFLEWLRLVSHHLDSPVTRSVSKDLNQAFQLAARSVFLGNYEDIQKFSFEVPSAKQINLTSYCANGTTSSGDDSSSAADGWSTIVLKYKFKWPLQLLFTPEVLARYNDLFRFLLRIKKTQHDLHMLWKTYKKSTNFGMCQMHNKLMFLMDNVQHYLQADVLESNYAQLIRAADSGDFGVLRHAHAQYLADVLSQSFVTMAASDNENSQDSLEINNPVFMNMMELLKLCDSFCEMSGTILDREAQDYYLVGYTDRYNKLVRQLMQLLSSLRERGCGQHLVRLLMRLDYNRWLSANTIKTSTLA